MRPAARARLLVHNIRPGLSALAIRTPGQPDLHLEMEHQAGRESDVFLVDGEGRQRLALSTTRPVVLRDVRLLRHRRRAHSIVFEFPANSASSVEHRGGAA